MAVTRVRKRGAPARADNEIRQFLLEYFYERNRNAKSLTGKTGAAATISVVRSDLKASHGLSAQEVVRNLTYLMSQGWVEERVSASNYPTPRGGVVPSVTRHYIITAAGIDKIEGPSTFTRDRFEGIRIEATGHNVITLGDGNKVSVEYRDLGQALADMKEQLRSSDKLDDETKLAVVVDIDAIQDQLLKSSPNRGVIRSLWEGIERIAVTAGLAASVTTVVPLIARFLA